MNVPRRAVAPLLAPLLSLSLATPAVADHVSSWKPITDGHHRSSESRQAAALHTPDGVLHVVYRVPTGSGGEHAIARTIAPSGAIGAPNTIVTFEALNDPNLTLVPSGLLALLPGLNRPDIQSIATATAPAGGSPWSLSPDDAAEGGSFYTRPAGATTDHAGVPYFSAGARLHRGIDPKTPNIDYQDTIGGGCCSYSGELATDGATGQVWLAWYSNASNEGVYVHEVDTATGAPKGSPQRMPGSVTSYEGSLRSSPQFYRVPIAGREGRSGVWLAWPGGYPTQRSVVVWRRGDAKSRVLHADSRATIEATAVAADPQGRVWVAWSEKRDDSLRIVARRSNPNGTSWGARTVVAAPKGAGRAWNLTPSAGREGELALVGHFQMPDGGGRT